MSVIETIDTTVTVEWDQHRTIGTLVEMGGFSAVLTALRAPEAGATIAFRVEGDTEEEAVTVDGVCVDVSDTGWGEQRCEIELLRVGTTCSASRLRDFIESWMVARGGSVHIGQARDGVGTKRFVYHMPERNSAARRGPSAGQRPASAGETGQLTTGATPLDLPDAIVSRQWQSQTSPEGSGAVDKMISAHTERRRPVRETIPASFDAANVLVGEYGFDDDEMPIGTTPERTLNTEVASGLLGSSGLDAAFRDALLAVEAPRIPRTIKETTVDPFRRAGQATGGPTGFEAEPPMAPRRLTPSSLWQDDEDDEDSDGDDGDELEPTRMMDAFDPDAPDEPPRIAFETGELSSAETSQLLEKIDSAIELERVLAGGESFDMDEPIIVSTVPHDVPFADPIQLGHDNKAPSITAMPLTIEMPAPPPPKFTGRERKMTVAESLSLPLRAPAPRTVAPEPEPLVAEAEADAAFEASVHKPQTREPSEALRRVAEIFAVDIAVRCELACQVQIGRKKGNATILRLAESKLRVRSEIEPTLYQRFTITLPSPDGGKKPFTLQCEVSRIREREEEGELLSYDVRVVSGNQPKDMALLRAVIQSFQAPGVA